MVIYVDCVSACRAPVMANPVEPVQLAPRKRKAPDVKNVHLVTTKFVPFAKMKEMEELGVVKFRKGRYSDTEKDIIDKKLKEILRAAGVQWKDFEDTLVIRGKGGIVPNMYLDIAQLVNRPPLNVYNYIRSRYHPGYLKLRFTSENIAKLERLYLLHGPKWEIISRDMEVPPHSCRLMYRHIQNKDRRIFTKEQSQTLMSAVSKMKVLDWQAISNLVRRSATNCRVEFLKQTLEQNQQKAVWDNENDYLLLQALYDLQVEDISEVDWASISWHLWTGVKLRTRYLLLRKRVYGFEKLSMDHILETLLMKVKPLSSDTISSEEE